MSGSTQLIIVASPSGAGKTTLSKKLLDEFRHIRFSVSTTTRDRRSKEVDGQDYFFVTKESFLELIERDAFAEWEEVHGKYYGTAHAEIARARDEERSLLLDLDYRGALSIKAAYPEAITIFILPPSMRELERRIRSRGENTEEQIQLRMSNALAEMKHFESFDYLIVNDEIPRAYGDLKSIVVADSRRTSRNAEFAETLLSK